MPNYIEMLKLEGHEEGGYYRVFYKSSDKVLPLNKQYKELEKQVNRVAGSSIYFLLEKKGFSAWHRLKSDEIWHYYDGGSPIDIHVIDDNGRLITHTLGNPSITENASFQVVINADNWFAAEVRYKTSFGLVGCTVSPGFEYDDFELAEGKKEQLIAQYPKLKSILNKFIKPDLVAADKLNPSAHNFTSIKGTKLSAADYIKLFNLEKHVEGGYFRLDYRAKDSIIPLDPRYTNKGGSKEEQQRCAGSSIYYLLEKQGYSAWHRLKSDEIWHYYDGGSPIDIHVINREGKLVTHTLGNPSITENASFQVVINAGNWFAAEVRYKTSFALVGCTVSPGFEYCDFELANRKILSHQYPLHAAIINRISLAT